MVIQLRQSKGTKSPETKGVTIMTIYVVLTTETDGTSDTTINAFATEAKARAFFETQKRTYINDFGCGNDGVIEDNNDHLFYWTSEEGFNDQTVEIELRAVKVLQ